MDEEALELQAQDIFSGYGIPAEMVRDLHAIAHLDARTVARIADHLSHLRGFAVEDSVKNEVRGCLQGSVNGDLAGNIMRALMNIPPDEVSKTIKTVDRWRRSTTQRKSIFPDELFASLDRNLQALVADFPSIALIRKANRLLRAAGNQFVDVSYFCDMRPVFDRPRQNVEGFVTLANLRLIYRGQDETKHACEVALTEDELKKLIKKSEEALAKLELLKSISGRLTQGMEDTSGGTS